MSAIRQTCTTVSEMYELHVLVVKADMYINTCNKLLQL